MTPHDVEKDLLTLKKTEAIEPDQIRNWILSDLACMFALPICAIFNSSLHQGFLPAVWHSADVFPIPKTAPPAQINRDLRPSSLTPVLLDMTQQLPDTLVSSNCWVMSTARDQIDAQQFGSWQGYFTVDALVELIHKWQQSLDSPGSMVCILLFDFTKVFDRFDDKILMRKLAKMDLPNFIVQCITHCTSARAETEGEDWQSSVWMGSHQCGCPTKDSPRPS